MPNTKLVPIDKDRLDLEDKLGKYERGHYLFETPPVCTAWWNTHSFIKFIDSYNGWLKVNPNYKKGE